MSAEICQFRTIKINVPQKMLLRLFYCKRSLTSKESQKLVQKLGQLERIINQLNHIKSIVEKLLLRGYIN